MLGYSITSHIVNGETRYYLQHGGDNRQSGAECAMINMKEIMDNCGDIESFDVYVAGTWYRSRGEGNVTCEMTLYSGGTMEGPNDYVFTNSGGTVVDNRSLSKNVFSKGWYISNSENYIDYVFANEQEAFALTGMEPLQALDFLASRCEIAVVKVGSKGAYIKRGNEMVTVAPMKANVIDTNGAGDMWAAGFLAGLVQDKDLKTCGTMGGIVAANVIEVLGTKMDAARWKKIHENLATL